MKVCNKCDENKPLSEYHRHKKSKDGHRNVCKSCVKAKNKAYYEANRERINARNKAYYEKNREKSLAFIKEWRDRNSEKVAAYQKEYYEANREELKSRHSERYSNDPEYRARYVAAATRRKRLLDSAVQEPYAREEIFERDGWTCQLCQEPIDPELQWPDSGFASIDHIIPISHGGDDTPDNVQAAHLSCNISKGNRVELEDQAMLTGVAG